MEMKMISPWKTRIARYYLGRQFDIERMRTELMNTPLHYTDNDEQHCTEDRMPYAFEVRRKLLEPIALDYLNEIYGYKPKNPMDVDCWGVVIADGRGMIAHNHPKSHLTSVLYLTNSPEEGQLVLDDPRGQASRLHPGDISTNHFGTFKITPEAGDFYIFPSYVRHSVTAGLMALRVSMITDFILKD